MAALNSNEEAHLKSFQELRDAPAIEVISDAQGKWLGDAGVVDVTRFRAYRNLRVDPDIEQCGVRVSELNSYWRLAEPPHAIGGEFSLLNFYDCVMSAAPKVGWSGSSEAELQLFSELRVVDYEPRGGGGQFAAVRIQPDQSPLEMWFYDNELGPPESPVSYLQMDTTYCEYLDALLLTKGTYGWRYLFCDVQLRGSWFERKVSELRTMLQLFPDLFPEYDYAPLRARLEARL